MVKVWASWAPRATVPKSWLILPPPARKILSAHAPDCAEAVPVPSATTARDKRMFRMLGFLFRGPEKPPLGEDRWGRGPPAEGRRSANAPSRPTGDSSVRPRNGEGGISSPLPSARPPALIKGRHLD